MNEPTLDELRKALREGRFSNPNPTDEEIQRMVDAAARRTESPAAPPPAVTYRPPHVPTPAGQATNPISSLIELIGKLIAGAISVAIVLGLAFVWIWFWSGDFHIMWNPILWIGLVVGLGAAFSMLKDEM